jgi:hypothetical protein
MSPKSGRSEIKREPAYDYAGYADSVFTKQSKIDAPGYRIDLNGKPGMMDVSGFGNITNMGTNESLNNATFIKRLKDL